MRMTSGEHDSVRVVMLGYDGVALRVAFYPAFFCSLPFFDGLPNGRAVVEEFVCIFWANGEN
jgi:hypothetical protein